MGVVENNLYLKHAEYEEPQAMFSHNDWLGIRKALHNIFCNDQYYLTSEFYTN